MSNQRDVPVIRASELGEYVYCARAWWLRRVEGVASRNTAALHSGRQAHDRHGRGVAAWQTQRRLALLLAILAGLTLLGNGKATAGDGHNAAILEAFANKHPARDYWVTFTCPEFTSLCPMTGQPDFATIAIQYIPDKRLVESKSLKLYLFGFRNRGDFHEDCVNIIMNDLIALMAPKYIEVLGRFRPRGGISIDPFCNHAPPSGAYAALAAQRFAWHNLPPPRLGGAQ